MNGSQFRRTIADATREDLDDFVSDRLLPALTDGDVTRDRLLRAMVDSEHAARGTFRQWAEDEDDSVARELFADVARQEEDHRDRVLDVLGEPYDPNDGGPLHTYLRGREDTVQRLAGGLVARPLVSIASYTRLVEFFEGESGRERRGAPNEPRAGEHRRAPNEPRAGERRGARTSSQDAATLARDLRADTDDVIDDALALLEARCDTDDWERARMAAEYTIQVAHDDFVDALRDTEGHSGASR